MATEWNNKTKDDLEKEKIFYETQQLKEKWWRKPAYILGAMPTLLGIISLIYVFFSGYLQAVNIKLENEKHDIEAQIKNFKEQKTKLENEVKTVEAEKAALESQKAELENQKKHLSEEVIKNIDKIQALQESYVEKKMKYNKQLKR